MQHKFDFTYHGFRTIYSCQVDSLGQHYIYVGNKFANIMFQEDDFKKLMSEGKIIKLAKEEGKNEAA